MKTADLHQVLTFPTTALDFYRCLLDERIHSSFTGSPATVTDKVGESFTAYDGYIEGKNIVLERGKKIIQTWKANEEEWPEHHFSEVVFTMRDTPEGCEVNFYHVAIPEALVPDIETGWNEYYWEPLRFYLNR